MWASDQNLKGSLSELVTNLDSAWMPHENEAIYLFIKRERKEKRKKIEILHFRMIFSGYIIY